MGGNTKSALPETKKRVLDALVVTKGAQGEAARRLGISRRRLAQVVKIMRDEGYDVPVSPQSMIQHYRKGFEVKKPRGSSLSTDELLAARKARFARREEHESDRALIPVTVKLRGPIGIWHAGDPHVDDDGTDIGQLERHVEIVRRTEGLFAGNVGDSSNNWTGRLARLYGEQSTSAAEAWQLVEWLITSLDWLYIIGGNHDAWSGAGDPIQWIAAQGDSLYQSSEARLALNFPNGRQVRVNARHDFAGSSQWNPAHGPAKAAIMGTRDHIFVAGHKHESAYTVLKDPGHGITMHCLKVASYKVYDRYARERGFRDMALSPCAVTVIDPDLPEIHPDMVKVFWDVEWAAEYLTWLRKRRKAA